MPAVIETMTIQELYQRMRALGMRTSVSHISDAIEQGKYPFAFCINGQKSRIYEIYTKLFDKWVEERAVYRDTETQDAS